MAYAFRARNLGPLREIDWKIPEGVSVVVGPNGVGKSTLLRLPEFVRIALQKSLNDAVTEVFEGTAYLKHMGAAATEPMSFGATLHVHSNPTWDVELNTGTDSFEQLSSETIKIAETPALHRAPGSNIAQSEDGRQSLGWRVSLIPRTIWERLSNLIAPKYEDIVEKIAAQISSCDPKLLASTLLLHGLLIHSTLGYKTYDFRTSHAAKWGSIHSTDSTLQPDGANIFSLLRNWRINSDHEARYEFVLSTLREAFPHVQKLDFEQAGQTVTVSVVDRRYSGKKTPISRESTGFLTAMMQLGAVASCREHGLVTLDELENSLHPRAVKVLIEAFRGWAAKHQLSIVLATQSETVLDQFQDDPSRIFVLEPNMTPGPTPLTELFTREWLSQFSVGDLFAHLEYGSLPPG